MTQDQNETQRKKLAKERLSELIEKEKNSHKDRKIRRAYQERIEKIDSRLLLDED